jgi:hypothetical protein
MRIVQKTNSIEQELRYDIAIRVVQMIGEWRIVNTLR